MWAWTFYILSVLFVFGAGIGLYLALRDEDDFLIKHAVALVITTLVLGLIPILNTAASLVIIGVFIVAAFDDNDSDFWFNKSVKSVGKKNK